MEISFESESLRYYERLYSAAFTHEETTEMIVPDALPDVGGVLMVEGTALLRGKEANTDSLAVTGVCDLSILYLPEEGGELQKLSMEAPFSAVTPCPGLTEQGRAAVSLRFMNGEARLLNSRKLLVRTEVCISAGVWLPRQLEWNRECRAENGVEVLTREYSLMPVTDVTEKTFSAGEVLDLPGGRPDAREILSARISLRTEEMNAVGSKLILRGTARTSVFYLAARGETGEAELQMPWSQILELEEEGAEQRVEVTTAVTGFRVVPAEEGGILVELGAVAQAVVRSRRNIRCVADAYGISQDLDTRVETVRMETGGEILETGDSVRLQLEAQKSVGRVVHVCFGMGRPHPEDGEYRATVQAKALCLGEGGGWTALSGRGETVCPRESSAAMTAEAGEAYGAVNGRGVEVRVPVNYRCPRWEMGEVRVLTGAETVQETESGEKQPAISVILTREGDSVWSLGKANRVSCAGIRQVNGLETEEEPAAGSLILVLRQR